MLIKIFLVAFLWASVANATPAYVQGATHSNGGTVSTTVVVTLPSPVGSGNTVFVSVGWSSCTPAPCSVTQPITSIRDDKLNNYNIVVSAIDTTDGYTFAGAYLINVTGGPTTITATLPSVQAYVSMVVDEFSGVPATSVLDNSSIAPQLATSGTDAVTSPSVTIVGGDLVYGSTVNVLSQGSESHGTGFTDAQHTPSIFISEYQTGVAAGSKAATFTSTQPSDWVPYIIALQVPSGGGAVAHLRLLENVGR